MPAEQYFQQIRRLVKTRRALREAESVEHRAVWLDENGIVRGTARLPDRGDHDELDDVLIENGLALDAPARTPTVADGGELSDPTVDVRFSEVNR